MRLLLLVCLALLPYSSDCTTCCKPGGVWSEWVETIPCTDYCGACGNTTKTRTCLSAASGCPCTGVTSYNTQCGIGVCLYPRLSCCPGYIKRIEDAQFVCGAIPQANDPNCTANPYGKWSAWTASVPCNDTCGMCGIQQNMRTCQTAATCPCTGDTSYQSRCNNSVCEPPCVSCCEPYSLQAVGGVSVCALAPGAQDCLQKPASCPDCCPTNGIWSDWVATTSCNDTCGSCATQHYQRKCLSASYSCPCVGPTDFNLACGTTVCLYPRQSCCDPYKKMIVNSSFLCGPFDPLPAVPPVTTTCCPPGGQGLWNDWGYWSACTATCGLCGIQSRSRTCASTAFGCPCVGNITESRKCANPQCTAAPVCCTGTYPAVGYDGFKFCQTTPAKVCTGTWGAWMNAAGASCNDTCGNCGKINQYRYCFPSGCQCSGAFTAYNPCANTVCLYPRQSCCAPYKKMIVNGAFVCG